MKIYLYIIQLLLYSLYCNSFILQFNIDTKHLQGIQLNFVDINCTIPYSLDHLMNLKIHLTDVYLYTHHFNGLNCFDDWYQITFYRHDQQFGKLNVSNLNIKKISS